MRQTIAPDHCARPLRQTIVLFISMNDIRMCIYAANVNGK